MLVVCADKGLERAFVEGLGRQGDAVIGVSRALLSLPDASLVKELVLPALLDPRF